jgi:peroxiredoxin
MDSTILSAILIATWVVTLLNLYLMLKWIHLHKHLFEHFTLPLGQPAPDFYGVSLDNKPFTLSQIKGAPVLMIFVSPLCKTCRAEMPLLSRLYPKIRASGTEMVIICMHNVNVKQFIDELHPTIPFVLPKRGSERRFNPRGLVPFFCLLDDNHIVQSSGEISEVSSEWKHIRHEWDNQEREERKKMLQQYF